jgi:hypothetical protein
VFRQKRGGHTQTQGRAHTNQEQERGWVGVRTANANEGDWIEHEHTGGRDWIKMSAQPVGQIEDNDDERAAPPPPAAAVAIAAMTAATAPAATAMVATTAVGAAAASRRSSGNGGTNEHGGGERTQGVQTSGEGTNKHTRRAQGV